MTTRFGRRHLRCSTLALSCLIGWLMLPTATFAQQAREVSAVTIVGPPPPDPPAMAARDAAGRLTMRSVRMDQPLTLDGRLDEAVYRAVPPVNGFIQQEPNEDEPATEKTDLWVFFGAPGEAGRFQRVQFPPR